MRKVRTETAFVEMTTYEQDIDVCLWYYLFCIEAKMNAEFITFKRLTVNYLAA